MQALVDRHRQFVDDTLTNGKPVKFTQDGRDVIKLPGLRRDASCGILYSLELLQQTVIHTKYPACENMALVMIIAVEKVFQGFLAGPRDHWARPGPGCAFGIDTELYFMFNLLQSKRYVGL